MTKTSMPAPDIDASVRGTTAQDGSQWVELKIKGKRSSWIALNAFAGTGTPAREQLADQNIVFAESRLRPDHEHGRQLISLSKARSGTSEGVGR